MAAGNTYIALATTTISSATASVTFSSISGAYTDLVIVGADLTTTTGGVSIQLEFNSDSGSNYSTTFLTGNGSVAASVRLSNQTKGFLGTYTAGTSATEPTNVLGHIMNYSNTTTYKTALARENRAGAEVEAVVNLWRSTAAITTIRLSTSSTWKTGSIFSLYGIAAA